MKIANQIIKREGDFVDLTEEQSKKILTEVNDHIMGVDLPIGPEDLAKGGRAGFQEGGLPAIDSRMNLDYDTLVEQNTDPMLKTLKAQNKNSRGYYTAPAPDGSLPPISELDKIREQVLKEQQGGPSDDMIFKKQPIDRPMIDFPKRRIDYPNLIERSLPQNSSSYYQGKDYGPGAGMAYAANNPDSGMRFAYDENGNRYQIPTSQPDSLENYLSGMKNINLQIQIHIWEHKL